METIIWTPIKHILTYNQNFSVFSQYYHHRIRDCVYTSVNRLVWCRSTLWFCTWTCSSSHCVHSHTTNITCKHNFCNSCWIRALDSRFKKLTSRIPLHLKYIHIIFTIPTEFRDFFRMFRVEWSMNILFQAAHKTLLVFFRGTILNCSWYSFCSSHFLRWS